MTNRTALIWLLLLFTIILVITYSALFGLLSLIAGLFRWMFDRDIVEIGLLSQGYEGLLWVGACIVVPALLLIPFYYVAVTRQLSRVGGLLGWVASAVYHGGMTWWLMFHASAMVNSGTLGVLPIALPLWIFTGAALVISIYNLRPEDSRPEKAVGPQALDT